MPELHVIAAGSLIDLAIEEEGIRALVDAGVYPDNLWA